MQLNFDRLLVSSALSAPKNNFDRKRRVLDLSQEIDCGNIGKKNGILTFSPISLRDRLGF